MGERSAQQFDTLFFFQFVDMVMIAFFAGRLIKIKRRFVGRRKDQQPPRLEDPVQFLHECFRGRQMFNAFKRHHHIKRTVFKRQRQRIGTDKIEPAAAVLSGGMGNGFFIQVHAGHMTGRLTQDPGAVAFAGCDIEYHFVAAQRSRRGVAVFTFQPGNTAGPGDIAFRTGCKRTVRRHSGQKNIPSGRC